MAERPPKGVASKNTGTYQSSRDSERSSHALMFNQLMRVEGRIDRIERSQDAIISGQAGLSERLIEQQVSLGKIDTTLDYIRDDIRRHDIKIGDAAQNVRRLELRNAEAIARRGAFMSVLNAVWQAKAYWLIPMLAAAAGYLAKKFGS